MEDSKVPKDFKIPAPEVIAGQGGTIYAYALPKQWGVNQRVVPNVGLSEHVAVLSTSRRHTERLLAATPLTVDGRRVKTDRPLAAASVLDVAGLIDAAAPWVDYAAEAIARSQGDGSGNNSASILDQVHVVIRVLKVCRSVTAEVYQQGKATVTHAHVEIHDVELGKQAAIKARSKNNFPIREAPSRSDDTKVAVGFNPRLESKHGLVA